jgi:hypothetical protein
MMGKIIKLKILRYNYLLMRLYGNGCWVSLYRGIQMCRGKKVRVHPGRRRDDRIG